MIRICAFSLGRAVTPKEAGLLLILFTWGRRHVAPPPVLSPAVSHFTGESPISLLAALLVRGDRCLLRCRFLLFSASKWLCLRLRLRISRSRRPSYFRLWGSTCLCTYHGL